MTTSTTSIKTQAILVSSEKSCAVGLRRHPPIVLDLSWPDLLAALGGCCAPGPGPDPAEGLPEAPVVSLCVRTAFELFLQAQALPAGSEVLVGAITHPDMVEILRHHNLVPVAVDLDPLTMAPTWSGLAQAFSVKSRALLVTHLFGARLACAEELAEWCAQRGLALWEDCAQAYVGPAYRGTPRALMSTFSFGPLKTSTALGGALTWVRDLSVRQRMLEIQATYPCQTNRSYAVKVLRYGVLHFLMQPRPYGLICALMELRKTGAVEIMRRWLAGFPGGFRVERLRLRPSPALLRMLGRRLRGHRCEAIAARQRAGDQVAARLPEPARPGPRALAQTYWIFPVLVDDRQRVLATLRRAGFDGMHGLSNLIALEPAPTARRLVEQSIIVSVRANWSSAERERLAQVLTCAHS